jgi:hypothetical protein
VTDASPAESSEANPSLASLSSSFVTNTTLSFAAAMILLQAYELNLARFGTRTGIHESCMIIWSLGVVAVVQVCVCNRPTWTQTV